MTIDAGVGRADDPPLVALEGITKRFPGVVANDAIDLELRAGEIHALIGENGAGKSTLMRVLYGMYPADEGRIAVRGTGVTIASPRDAIALGIGMVHQHFVLVDPFTVTENIILGRRGRRGPRPRGGSAKVATLADEYGFRIDPSAIGRRPVGRRGAAGRDPEGAVPGCRDPRSSTSPRRCSRRRRRWTCSRTSNGCARTGSPSCSSATSSMRCSRSPTASRCCGEARSSASPARQTYKAGLAEMMVGRPVLFRLEKPDVDPGEPVFQVARPAGGRQAQRASTWTCAPARSSASRAWRATGSGSWPTPIMGLRPVDGLDRAGRSRTDRDVDAVATQRRSRVRPGGSACAGARPGHVALGERGHGPARRRAVRRRGRASCSSGRSRTWLARWSSGSTSGHGASSETRVDPCPGGTSRS